MSEPAADSIVDVAGLSVGHFTDRRRPTGCTVVLVPEGATGGVDVRGAAPGTRETELLAPLNAVEQVHAVLLSGGSAFGLDAAGGVSEWQALTRDADGDPTGVVYDNTSADLYGWKVVVRGGGPTQQLISAVDAGTDLAVEVRAGAGGFSTGATTVNVATATAESGGLVAIEPVTVQAPGSLQKQTTVIDFSGVEALRYTRSLPVSLPAAL